MSSSTVEVPTAQMRATPTAKTREPNFFVVGAAKAGTTSLVEYLRRHPDVFMPGGEMSQKEPSHFCDLLGPVPPWLEKYREFNSYLELFADAGECRAVGEASVGYLTSAGAENRIHARFPDARIIIMLRNPADRVYSWYSFMCQLGIEPGRSFERALAEEDERTALAAQRRDSWFSDHATVYFRYGLIASDVERFMRRFPREQIHVVLFDDLKGRPKETTRAVYEFLGVAADFTPSFKIYNPTWFPFSVRLQHFLAMQCRTHPLLPHRAPVRFVDERVIPFAGKANAVLGRLRTRVFNPATRRELLNRYREDIQRTEALIGRRLDGWLRDA
jgi:hypothetical protein